MNDLLENIQSKIKLSQELKTAILSSFKEESFSKKSIIQQENRPCNKIYFLSQGTARTFYLHNDNEVTSWFYKEGQFFTSWYSFFNKEASFENMEALEDCTVYSIGYDSYQNLMETFHEFESFGRQLMEEQVSFLTISLKDICSFQLAKSMSYYYPISQISNKE